MAKKKTETSGKPSRVRFVDTIAFFGLAIAAILLVVGPMLRYFLKDTEYGPMIMQILNIVAMVCLLAAIALPAWYFVRNKKKGWKIFYFIALAIYIIGAVCGVTLGIL